MMLVELVFKFHRGVVSQGAVEPLWVVKGFDIIKHAEPGLGARGWCLLEAFGFQCGHERLGKSVVVRIGHGVSSSRQPVIEQFLAVTGTGVLAPSML